MNQLMTLGSTEPLTMSSLEIAELTGKAHAHVLRDIRRMLEDLGEAETKFGSSYQDASGRALPKFDLDKELTTTLVAGYSTVLRRRIVARWMELEQAKAQPVALTPMQALLGAVQQMADIEAKQQTLALQQQAQAQATAMTQQAVVEVAEKVQGLEQSRLVPVYDKRPIGAKNYTQAKDMLRREYGLSDAAAHYTMRLAPYAPQKAGTYANEHAEAGSSTVTCWWEVDIRDAARRFVSECKRETANLFAHPKVASRFALKQ